MLFVTSVGIVVAVAAIVLLDNDRENDIAVTPPIPATTTLEQLFLGSSLSLSVLFSLSL
jgi:hypothetical protein